MSAITDVAPVPATRTTDRRPWEKRRERAGAALGVLAGVLTTSTAAQTAPVFLTGFVTSQGLLLAQVRAAAVVSLPVLLARVAAQDELAQGLSLGADKPA